MHWNQCKQSWNLWLTETTLQKNVLLVRITQSNTSKKKIQVKHGCFCFIFLYPLIIMTMSLYALNSLFLEILFSSRGSIGINVSCWTMCFFFSESPKKDAVLLFHWEAVGKSVGQCGLAEIGDELNHRPPGLLWRDGASLGNGVQHGSLAA